ncbi:MAG TPA: hypothetical protein VK028_10760 [Micromonosporaceae bacterium]|nr:hypothetical protein [Micromonosporaceae bacterium]
MRTRLAVIAVAALTALTASACVQAPASPTPSPTPTKSAITVLEEAAAKSKGLGYKYELTYGDLLTGDGYLDASGTRMSRNVTIKDQGTGLTIKVGGLIFPDAFYLKLDLGSMGVQIPGLAGIDGKWLEADVNKIGKDGVTAFLTSTEAHSLDGFIDSVVAAEQVSPTEITGTVDITNTAVAFASPEEMAAVGDAAKNVPFTVTLDSEGRVGKIVMKLPAMSNYPAADLTTTFSEYGTPIEIPTPSADETMPAPEMIYLFLQQ